MFIKSETTEIAVDCPPAPSPTKIFLFPDTVSNMMAFKFLLTEDNSFFFETKKGATTNFKFCFLLKQNPKSLIL